MAANEALSGETAMVSIRLSEQEAEFLPLPLYVTQSQKEYSVTFQVCIQWPDTAARTQSLNHKRQWIASCLTSVMV